MSRDDVLRLGLNPDVLLHSARAEAAFGRAYSQAQPMASGTILTSAALKLALVSPSESTAALRQAARTYASHGRPYGALVATASGDSRLCSQLVRFPFATQIDRMVRGESFDEPRLDEERVRAGSETIPPASPEELPNHEFSDEDEISVIMAEHVAYPRSKSNFESPVRALGRIDPALPLWSGVFAAGDVVRLLVDIAGDGRRVPELAVPLLRRAEDARQSGQADIYHWQNLSIPPFSLEELALAQVITINSDRPEFLDVGQAIGPDLSLPLRVAAQLRRGDG